jgi:nitrous oxidase accessory protein
LNSQYVDFLEKMETRSGARRKFRRDVHLLLSSSFQHKGSSVKRIVAGWLAIALFLILSELKAQGRELRVCAGCDLKSPAEAIAVSRNGDTVLIDGGLHRVGTLAVDRSITLRGINGATLDGEGKGHVIDMLADGITIEGLIIENPGVSDMKEFAAIHGESVHDCRLRFNVLRNATYGIYLARSERCLIERNVSLGNAKDEVFGGNGIHLWYSSNNRLFGNTVISHRDGIYFEFSENLEVKDNSALSNIRYGLHFMFCHRSHIEGNRFYQNATGTALMYSRHLELVGNAFNDSQGPSMQGLLLKDITDSVVKRNTLTRNTTGVLADNSSRNRFEDNLFVQNGRALEVFGNAQKNTFHGNIFFRNTFDVATNTRDNTNDYDGNYWDRYQGFDLDRDGKGDVPYSPVQIFSFWVSKYPELSLLAGSSMLNFLEIMEKAFPVLTPSTLKDKTPLMRRPLRDKDGL